MKRAESSGREDDNEDTILKRVDTYLETSEPVVDYYKKFGKVRIVDANGTDEGAIYAKAKEAILP
jgi:adenylate kinase family enzyme